MRTFILLLAAFSLTSAAEAVPVRIFVQLAEPPPEIDPVPVVLYLFPQAGEQTAQETQKVTLNAPGDAQVDLAPGRVWRLEAQADGYWAPEQLVEPAEKGEGEVWVMVEEDRETAPLKLVVRENTEVKGRIVSSLGPVPGAELVAFPAVDQVAFASSVSAVTGVDGSFTLRFASSVRAFQLFVFAPGHAFHMRTAVVERDRPLEVAIDAVGGTLAIELPVEVKPETPLPLLVHNGTFLGLSFLRNWLRLQGARPARSGRIEIPNMEPGAYSLCVNASPELRQGKEPADGRCAGGFLSPQGELTLRIPSPGK